ncbi:MAG TPA: hypothetical protein PLL78_01300 [Fimbriimonadaceae bacterium]|nr:hypothetical protein [Fimbriimonadaceae bacterium]
MRKRLTIMLSLFAAQAVLAQPGIPVSMSTTQGVREAGDLFSLATPDTFSYTIRASNGTFRFAEAVYTAQNSLFRLSTAVRLNLYLKLQRSTRGNVSIDVFNWRQNAWETKDIRYDITGIDSYYQLAAGRDFFSSSGVVRVRIRSRQSILFRMHFDAVWIVATA